MDGENVNTDHGVECANIECTLFCIFLAFELYRTQIR